MEICIRYQLCCNGYGEVGIRDGEPINTLHTLRLKNERSV